VLLGVAVTFAAIFLLLPMLAIRRVWSEIPYKLDAGLYFAALGLGFMFIGACLIQYLTLFLGYPTYSLTVTLFSILISTGVGSPAERALRRRAQPRPARAAPRPGATRDRLSLWLDTLVDHAVGWP
jgi:hypothetical protein